MALKEGAPFPESKFQILEDGKPKTVVSTEMFKGKKVVICGVPGAFTPTCSDNHLPSFIKLAPEFKAKGVDMLACLSVNDAFVMSRWIKSLDPDGDNVTMLSDGDAGFAKANGLSVDTGLFGGSRLRRLAMIVNDGTVEKLLLETGTDYTISSGDAVFAAL